MANKAKVYTGTIDDLHFDDKNFNKHTKRGMEMLSTSVRSNGFGRSVLVDKDNNIVAGNGVVETAGNLGKSKIRVIETTGDELVVVKRTDLALDSKEGREMAAADNAVAAVDLEWNDETLVEMRNRFNLNLEQYGLDLSPFDMDADTNENANTSPSDVKEDDYDQDLTTAPQKTVSGDLWLMGQHRVICGDSTNPEVVKRLMAGEQADLLLTDPPYNVAYTGGTSGSAKKRDAIANDNMESDAFRAFLTGAMKNALDGMKAGAGLYVWYAIAEHTNFDESVKAAGFKVSEYLLWVKNALVLGRMDYHYRHEPCIYGWKTGAGHKWYGDRSQTTVLEFDKPTKSVDHPTMKPVPLFAYQMGNSTKTGDIVLDIFAGSGTTMVAAESLNRKARLVEFEPHYVDVILDRYINLVGTHKDVYLVNADGTKTPYTEVKAGRV